MLIVKSFKYQITLLSYYLSGFITTHCPPAQNLLHWRWA